MATLMQEAAVERLVEIGGKSVSRAMRTSTLPYAEKTAKTPKKLTESVGYKEILKKYGLTDGLITRSLVSDIKRKPRRRLGELNLGAEMLGLKSPPEGANKTLIVVISGESAKRYGTNSLTPSSI